MRQKRGPGGLRMRISAASHTDGRHRRRQHCFHPDAWQQNGNHRHPPSAILRQPGPVAEIRTTGGRVEWRRRRLRRETPIERSNAVLNIHRRRSSLEPSLRRRVSRYQFSLNLFIFYFAYRTGEQTTLQHARQGKKSV